MNKHWVVNSSPIILLSKIGQVALLHELSDELVIPAGVAQEIQQGAENDAARRWLKNEGQKWVRETDVIIGNGIISNRTLIIMIVMINAD